MKKYTIFSAIGKYVKQLDFNARHLTTTVYESKAFKFDEFPSEELEYLNSNFYGNFRIHVLPRTLTIIESPYAGDIKRNVEYARKAVKDSLMRYEAPIASHLLYTQEGILNDDIPNERTMGIDAGLAWREAAQKIVFYIDYGYSNGMKQAQELYEQDGFEIEERKIL